MWCELDPEALEGLGQLVRVLEALGVCRPGRRDPDLGVVARADDHRLIAQIDVLAQVGRQQDPALTVEVDLRGAREDQPLEAARVLVGDGQRRDLRGERVPTRLGVDRQAGVEPAGDDRASAELDAEPRGRRSVPCRPPCAGTRR